MNPIQLRAVGTALFYLFIFLSGLWLNRSGMPYSTFILTIHKLIALGAGAYIVVAIYRRNQLTPLSTIEVVVVLVTGLFFIGAIISGGLVSTGKAMPEAILRLHQITPFLTVIATAVTLYLLLSKPGSPVTILR